MHQKAQLPILRYLLCTFFLFCAALHAQELPPVLNFTPNEYSAGNQNWMISKSENGNIYVANNRGLLEFNGARWQLYPVPNNTVVRAVKAVDDKIFTGAYMEVGYWEKNASGLLEYTSLLRKFPGDVNDGEQFWRIEKLGETLIFQSFEGIYLYQPQRDILAKLPVQSSGSVSNLFKVESEIYFQIPGAGLFTIENAVGKRIIPSEKIEGKEIVHISQNGEELWLLSRSGDLLGWNGEGLENLGMLTEEIPGISIFSALRLEDASFFLGTVENGLYHISAEGEILKHFDQQKGLQNNTVLSLFLDEQKNVWAGLDNGISVVNLNSPFRLFQDHSGRLGTVYTSFQNENYLYLGTNHGLYYKTVGQENFHFIPGTSGQVWNLQGIDSILFASHNDGTFVVREGEAEQISKRQGTWTVVDFKPLPGVFVHGHYNGFSLIQKTLTGWKNYPMVESFPHSSKFIVSEEGGEIWIGNEHKGVFRIQLDDSLKEIKEMKNYPLKEESGITSSLFSFNEELYYANIESILKYDSSTDSFVAENELAQTFENVNRTSGKMLAVEDRVFGFGKYALFNAGVSRLERGYALQAIYLPQEYRSIPLGYENVTSASSETYLLGLVDGYLLFNDQNEIPVQQDLEVRIDRITKAAIDEPATALPLIESPSLNYTSNNLTFYFSIPEYQKYVVPLYSYRLKGMSGRWSDWEPEAVAAFKNLESGDYEFEVRGRIGDDVISSTAFAFSVEKPWYLSNLAVAVYVLLFLLFLYVIHLVYQKEHQKRISENEKALRMRNLEAEREIIKLQNEQLEKEMAGKNKELAVSTMSLIKKNEFLTSIKEKLKESGNPAEVKSVIRTIDKDISEEDNWKFFKEAFNNADKEFFKKIKAKHPELTSNDLKLCAYLRLNLSSKEIAPLLNISVKSVEIKRYRLRKKMHLPRETNLVDYIFEI